MCKHTRWGNVWHLHVHTNTERACPAPYLKLVFTLTCTAKPFHRLALRLAVPAGFSGVKWGAHSLLLVGVKREEGGKKNASFWPTPGITLLTLGCLDPWEPRNSRAKGGRKGVRGGGGGRGARGVWTSLRSLWRGKRCPHIGAPAMTLPVLWPPLTLTPPSAQPSLPAAAGSHWPAVDRCGGGEEGMDGGKESEGKKGEGRGAARRGLCKRSTVGQRFLLGVLKGGSGSGSMR